MIEENLLIILVVLPFLAAIAAMTLSINARNAEAWMGGLTMLTMLGILVSLRPFVQDGGSIQITVFWVDAVSLNLRFVLDGFSWLFMVLVSGIGFLVVLYARYYMSPDDPVPRFYGAMMAFTGSMAGVLLSGNMIMLVVFWELTSFTSFLLISYWNQKPEARDGARTALIVTATGGLCLLGGVLILGHIAGGFDFETVFAAADRIRAHPLYVPALVLVLLGAFTKSAQFPFHFWLPSAMAAPTPVSAYLHSATMVKAGVYLLVRFFPVLGGTDQWFALVVGVGITTLLVGSVVALFRHDLKGLLAYSTISHLGLITTLVGIGSPLAIIAAIFHIVNHAVFKASLFMVAGIIDHETGTRDMRRLSGLRKWLPVTTVLAIIASAAMAGVPLLNGFLSKEMFFDVAAAWNNGSPLDNALPYLATIAGAFSVAYSLRFVLKVFFGPPSRDLPIPKPHEPPALMRRPVEVLAVLCLAVGIMPMTVLGEPLRNASIAILGGQMPDYFSVKLWHGFNTPLMMSMIAIVLGMAIYLLNRKSIDTGPEGPPLIRRLNAKAMFDKVQGALSGDLARGIIHIAGTTRLQPQLRALVMAAVWSGLLVLPGTIWWAGSPDFGLQELLFALLWAVGATCAIGAAVLAKYHRFVALVMMGGAGLVTCVSFVWLSAPDLAVTQLLVEIVTTVLLLLGLRWLPQRRAEIAGDKAPRAKMRRGADLMIAIISGGGIAAMAYVVMMVPPGLNVGDWFLRNAYSEGGGTNVVNVILVDFRAFDTFGEITVLSVVGLTVFALLRRFRPAPESAETPSPQKGGTKGALDSYMFVVSIIMNWLLAAAVVLGAYLFFRGHDLPGGGFAAGVTVAIGLMLQYIATNTRWVESRLTVLPVRWIAIGLLIALATGLGSWLFGYPFLTTHAQYVHVPLIGNVPAATALLFDIGVFAVVLGSVVLMLVAIAHQSLRVERKRPQRDRTEAAEGEA
ncbi:MAG: monovalent cation/H+ antiporter subunit A [Paracoccus sp. (in: a-proteobacteria)]|uniref:monovalent cation/H+ antiporter subunit A n=1 Tax=Paracoccus sp. TaxID=267 RepID=UPI0026DF614D|nr:monovalent cation/H+ antiporter subunit A [Paracoccus sp. (in: a-proteobacteria)]MDO5631300.1 monovalent cation/H+ antiporter subunit A [Paracoccus sp. (in: a-proteobacteria)]